MNITGITRTLLGVAAVTLLLLTGCTIETSATDSQTGNATAAEENASGDTKTKTKSAKPKAKPEPEYTVAQENAIQAAQDYVDIMPFSRAGLLDQMTSEYGSQFKPKDAEFAVNHIKVDWNAEAVEAAKSYLDTMAFSRQGLIDQMTSEYGSQFTMKQAVYAVNKVGL